MPNRILVLVIEVPESRSCFLTLAVVSLLSLSTDQRLGPSSAAPAALAIQVSSERGLLLSEQRLVHMLHRGSYQFLTQSGVRNLDFSSPQ